MAVDDLLVKLAKMFPKPKLQTVFLINNYDMTISILKVIFLYSLCFKLRLPSIKANVHAKLIKIVKRLINVANFCGAD